MSKLALLIFVSLFSANANAQDKVVMPGIKADRNIFYETGTLISRKQIEGKISPEEVLKLTADLRKIQSVDRNSGMQRFRETGDRMSFMAHDPACVAAARKIYTYLQTKNTVNDSWKGASSGKAGAATSDTGRAATPPAQTGDQPTAPQQN